jgi:hypothetical protein
LLNITNRDRTQVFPTYEVFSRIKIVQQRFKTSLRKNNFAIRVAKVWNKLPDQVINAASTNALLLGHISRLWFYMFQSYHPWFFYKLLLVVLISLISQGSLDCENLVFVLLFFFVHFRFICSNNYILLYICVWICNIYTIRNCQGKWFCFIYIFFYIYLNWFCSARISVNITMVFFLNKTMSTTLKVN